MNEQIAAPPVPPELPWSVGARYEYGRNLVMLTIGNRVSLIDHKTARLIGSQLLSVSAYLRMEEKDVNSTHTPVEIEK